MRRIVLCLLGLTLTVGIMGCGEKKPATTTPAPAAGAADAGSTAAPADKPAEK
jgi:hypothetical protein